MTNLEIIVSAMQLAEIPLEKAVNTYVGWKRKGYSVKRGETAAFKTRIWKPVSKRVKDSDIEAMAGGTDDKKLILVTAHFFTEDQVVKEESKC